MRTSRQFVRKVRMLCSSGLPLYALVKGLSHEIRHAIPFSSNSLFLDSSKPTCGIFPTKDMTHWAAPLHYFRSLPSSETGIVPFWELIRNHDTLVPPDSYFLPHFERSAAYREFYRHIGIHHATAVILRGPGFQAIFSFSRSEDMEPFSNEELRLLRLLAPHFRHGLSIAFSPIHAGAPDRPADSWGDLVPLRNPGLLLLSPEGHVLSMDERASELLVQRALMEKVFRLEDDESMRRAFRQLARSVSEIFDPKTDSGPDLPPPSEILLPHASGFTLSLKGFRLHGETNSGHVGVNVRHITRKSWLSQKLKAHYALSKREIQILERLSDGQDSKSILFDLKIARETLNTYVSRLLEKTGALDIETLKKDTLGYLSGFV